MSDSYIEDDGDEFPINNHVCCGQVPYKVDFEGASIDDSSGKTKPAMSRSNGRAKFLPKAINPSKK
jgi:hypothetical protein